MAAVAIGSTIFNMIYWLFAFLRMGTTGLTAQANGMGKTELARSTLGKSCIISIALGGLILLLQTPIFLFADFIMKPSGEILPYLSTYFHICIWGAPAVLALYSLNGFFVGMQDTKSPMYVAIFQNVANILLSLCMVFALKKGIAGVAWGTMIAQWMGLLLALYMLRKHKDSLKSGTKNTKSETVPWKRFFSVNSDIFFRTLCLVAVTVYFTKAGSAEGKIVLAANTLLMQFFIIYSYITDGLANAAEALTGKYAGAKETLTLKNTIRALFICGTIVTLCFTLFYTLLGKEFLFLLTDIQDVRTEAMAYFFWVCIIPVAALPAMIWDGIFIGLTYTRGMLVSMFLAMLVFFCLYSWEKNALGNHALWLAFVAYLLFRGIVQTLLAVLVKFRQ